MVPAAGRAEVMEELHTGHPGISRMKSLARSFVWWPGIDSDLEGKVKSVNHVKQTVKPHQTFHFIDGFGQNALGHDCTLIMLDHSWKKYSL